ncbi:MAG: sulfatase-like hydrolase/transferase [Akkermansiaceae bacterium]
MNVYRLTACYTSCLILLSSISAADEHNVDSVKKPNVVIFYTDDQGTLDANCYGSKDLYTPTMDKLAETGIRFTQAYAHTVCCPSRAMLLTGRYPQRSNVTAWTQSNAKGKKGRNMAREEITLAEVLKKAGYKTALFGKWHLGADFAHGPTEQGFDEFYGLRGGFIDNYKHYALHGTGFHDLYEGKKEVFEKDKYFPDLVTKRALNYISRNKAKPFFLYVAFNIPHYPEQADAKFEGRYKDLKQPRKRYAKMISTTDDHMGQILNRLESEGLRDNTIILFMSDNGHSPENYEIRVDHHTSGLAKGTIYAAGGGGNTGQWKGHKGTFLEGGIRVPAIISYPAKLPQGKVRNHAITAMDWMPTILKLCDIPLPEVKLDGKCLVASLHKEPKEPLHQVMHWAWRSSWAVRDGDWKLIGSGDEATHLVCLSDDDPEEKNHLKEKPHIATKLKALHDSWLKEVTP